MGIKRLIYHFYDFLTSFIISKEMCCKVSNVSGSFGLTAGAVSEEKGLQAELRARAQYYRRSSNSHRQKHPEGQ